MDRDNSKNAMELINEECQSQGAGLILTSLGTQEAKCDVEYKL